MKKPRMREKKWYAASERCERARAGPPTESRDCDVAI